MSFPEVILSKHHLTFIVVYLLYKICNICYGSIHSPKLQRIKVIKVTLTFTFVREGNVRVGYCSILFNSRNLESMSTQFYLSDMLFCIQSKSSLSFTQTYVLVTGILFIQKQYFLRLHLLPFSNKKNVKEGTIIWKIKSCCHKL